MIKLSVLGIIILLLPIAVIADTDTPQLTILQKDTLEQTLDLAEGDKQKYEKVLGLLNEKQVDLSNEIALSDRIYRDSVSLGINISDYGNIKLAQISIMEPIMDPKTPNPELPEPSGKSIPSNSINLAPAYTLLLSIITALTVTLLIFRRKHKRRQMLENWVDIAKKKGYSDFQIKSFLIGKGLKEKEIKSIK